MTLEAKTKMIEGLIRENPESTIADYLVLLADIESIERGDMVYTLSLPDPSIQLNVLAMAASMTNRGLVTISDRYFDLFRRAIKNETIEPSELPTGKTILKRAEAEITKVKDQHQRPPAEYSNHSPWQIAS